VRRLIANFASKYKPKPKPARRNHWGRKKLAELRLRLKAKKVSPGQQSLWDDWNLPVDEVVATAKQFVLANCFNPDLAALQFQPP
jgi:putative transposase